MMTYATGDICAFNANAVVNPINCRGAMGRGVALAVKKRYPQIMNPYKTACRAGFITPGSLWCWTAQDGTIVYNIATKDDWRDPSQSRWVEAGLSRLSLVLSHTVPMTVVVPPLGCGCGGLHWDVVKPMIANALGEQTRHKIIVLEPQ